MNAQEPLAEFGLQRLQRVLDQIVAARVVHHDILFFGLKVANVLHGNQPQTAAQARAQMAARLAAVAGQRRGAHSRRLVDGLGQALAPHRFDQIIDGGGLKGLQRTVVVGRAKHHRRARLLPGQMTGDFHAIHHRHRDVQQDQIGMQLVGQLQRLAAVSGFASHADAGHLREHLSQPLAGQGFIVDDQYVHHGDGSGISSSHR